jgi:uncharacterized repeat protein (TIGR02543 family)
VGKKEGHRGRFYFGSVIATVLVFGFFASIFTAFSAFAAANIIKIQNIELTELSATATGSISSFTETGIVGNVTFHQLNDSAKFVITLKNTDSKDHVIESITDDNDSEYVSYTYDAHNDFAIAAGESFDLSVVAKYVSAVPNVNTRAQATNVKFTIKYTGEEEPDVVPIVPDTSGTADASKISGTIRVSIISLVISAAGLIIVGVIVLKKNKKHNKIVAALVAIISVATVSTAVKAATVEINTFTLVSTYNLEDKLVVKVKDADGVETEQVINYGEKITPTAPEKTGYTFTGWEDGNGDAFDPATTSITSDTTLNPVYTKNTYTIQFDKNQGTGTMADLPMVYDEAKNLTANAFTRTGYHFTGWNKQADGEGDSFTDGQSVENLTTDNNGTIILYAQWQANTYTIAFDANGGSGEMSNLEMTYGTAKNLTANAFTYTGHAFTGWNTQSDGQGTNYADEAEVNNLTTENNAEITLFAKWSTNSYTIIYNNNGGTGSMSNTTCDYGADCTLRKNTFTKTGYKFNGWKSGAQSFTDEQVVNSLIEQGSITLETQWQAISYTISFDANGGTGSAFDLPMVYDTAKNLTANGFAKTGHTFAGWNTQADGQGTSYADEAEVNNLTTTDGATVTLYAKWTANTYSIIYNGNGGTGTMENTTCTYGVNCSLRKNTFTKQGYKFNGWKNGAESYTDEQVVSNLATQGSVTLEAQWTPIEYTISFNGNQSTSGSMDSITAHYDENVNLPASGFTRTGYTQNGWKNGAEDITDQATVHNLTTTDGATITLDANWVVNTYTISFNANEGTGTMPNLPMTYGTAANLTKNTYTRDNYSFAGWNTQADGQGTSYADEAEVNNLTAENNATVTLYAQWTEATVAYVCKVAEELHTQPCESTGSCNSLTNTNISGGFFTTINGVKTINYGYLPNSTSLKPGDAFDCDVNNDGDYDSENERFYYVGDDGTNARFIFHAGYNNGINHGASANYSTALTYLPDASVWTNPSLVEFSGEGLTTFISIDDVKDACGITSASVSDASLKPCIFLMENSTFYKKKVNDTVGPRSGTWIHVDGSSYMRMHTTNIKVDTAITDSSSNAARPVIQVPLQKVEPAGTVMKTVTFDVDGGTAIAPVSIERGKAIGNNLPVTATGKNGYSFVKWSLTANGESPVDAYYVVSDNVIIYAIWKEDRHVAIINGEYQKSLQDAVTLAPNNVKTTVTLLEDTTEKITTTASQDIILDLGGHTLNYDKSNTIVNKGTLEITNGTVICSTSSGAIDNNANATLIISDDTTVNAVDSRQAIYNNGGSVTISGDDIVLTSTASQRATIHNRSNGNIVIESGTITSTSLYALYNESGTITIGKKDGVIDPTSPVITGETYGIAAYTGYNFYDGIIRGKTAALGVAAGTGNTPAVSEDATEAKILDIETDATKFKGPDGSYTVFYLYFDSSSPDEIVNFYTPSDAAKSYFANITTWSDGLVYVPYSSTNYTPSASMTAYWTQLKSNFDNNNCRKSDLLDVSSDFNYTYANGGTVNCDQPKAYDTGVNGSVSVYLSDENTKVKGDAVSYTRSDSGKITNMIPGTTYYWESNADSSVYGYVKAEGERRFITTSSIRNVRDLGGLTTTDGKTVKYGILMRGEKLRTNASNATDLADLGITKEYDLRGEGASDAKMTNYLDIRTRHYHFNYSTNSTELSYYNDTRNALTSLMRDVVENDEKIYFHCTYGADRTGTIAWLVETLLGVELEQRIEDYELTTLAGEADRTRIYDHKLNSSFYGENKFVYMRGFVDTKTDVENWYKAGLTAQADIDAADALIASFRSKMLE